MNGGAIVVTASLQPIRVTLGHLLVVELAVGLGVLVLTGGLGLALARQATRPLEEIAATADAIAAGEMDRRVPAGRNGSETGRVARALNTMLTQIQDAFGRRDATEARLRTFVADASHELSTPLTSIRGYAELFHRGLQDRPEDLAKALRRIESEAARMGVLVDELLTLASFDAGRPLARDPVDLRGIAADTAGDLQAVEPARTVELDAPQPVIVAGDEARLRQVAANLVSNVRRYTPPGTPVTVRAQRRDGAEEGGARHQQEDERVQVSDPGQVPPPPPGRDVEAQQVGQQWRLSSERRAAETSCAVSLIDAAAMLSSRCPTEPVPGIGSTDGERASSQARTI